MENGLETVVAATGLDTNEWVITPVPPYQIGNRVPLGAQVVLKSVKRTNLSADPAYPKVRLSPNADKWEQWTFVKR